MLNRKKLKANKSLSINVSLFKGFLKGGRALVVSTPLNGFKEEVGFANSGSFFITDFFDVVIAENERAAKSLPFADFVFYQEDSAYKNSVMQLEKYSAFEESIICTNYRAVEEIKKLNRSISLDNINYLPVGSDPMTNVGLARGVWCGLSKNNPGVHLATILGCKVIMTEDDNLEEFVAETAPRKILPKNLVKPNRRSLLKTNL